MKNSLRARLLAGTLSGVALVWIVLAVGAWLAARHETEELFDAHLAQTAALLAAVAGTEPEEFVEHLPPHHYARKVAVQIWADGKRLIAHSTAAPETRLSPSDDGFSDADGWRVYSLRDVRTGYLIQVAEASDARRAVGRELALHLLAPLALALPLLGMGLVLLIRRSLAPLDSLAGSISQRSPERLDPIALDHVPRELHPILDRLNALLARIGHSMEQERRFTADAAHELRTPLAAMRTHAQVAQGSRDADERAQALANVIAATDRATHLVEQLLMLARLDANDVARRFTRCDLRAIAASAIAQMVPTALTRAIDFNFSESDAAPSVNGDATLLGVALRNLLDNAVRYSPAGSQIDVGIDTDSDGRPRLTVSDRGPGIPAAERQNVLDRFYRIVGNEAPGTGLGLAIVVRIADLHGAQLSLDDGPLGKGLTATLRFPA